MTLEWDAATDRNTRVEELVYEVYRSNQNNIDTPKRVLENGIRVATLTNEQRCTVTNLSQGQRYYFNVVVKNLSGGETAYAVQAVTTQVSSDTAAPVPRDAGNITAQPATLEEVLRFHDNAYPNDVTVRWAKAIDGAGDSSDALTYRLYRSEKDNLQSVDDAEKNGSLITTRKDADLYVARNMKPHTTYYFTVVVNDEVGNKSVYRTVSFTTGE
jgi:hypothetical protein